MEQQTKPKSQVKAKKKTDNRRGFNLKFTAEYLLMLEEMKKQCGFRSTYEMLMTIIQCFVRYVVKRREQIRMKGEPRDSVANEIEEMFADLEDSEPTPANTAKTVTRHKPSERRLYGREDEGDEGGGRATPARTPAPRALPRNLTKRTTTRTKAPRTPTTNFLTMATKGAGLIFGRVHEAKTSPPPLSVREQFFRFAELLALEPPGHLARPLPFGSKRDTPNLGATAFFF